MVAASERTNSPIVMTFFLAAAWRKPGRRRSRWSRRESRGEAGDRADADADRHERQHNHKTAAEDHAGNQSGQLPENREQQRNKACGNRIRSTPTARQKRKSTHNPKPVFMYRPAMTTPTKATADASPAAPLRASGPGRMSVQKRENQAATARHRFTMRWRSIGLGWGSGAVDSGSMWSSGSDLPACTASRKDALRLLGGPGGSLQDSGNNYLVVTAGYGLSSDDAGAFRLDCGFYFLEGCPSKIPQVSSSRGHRELRRIPPLPGVTSPLRKDINDAPRRSRPPPDSVCKSPGFSRVVEPDRSSPSANSGWPPSR